MCVKIERMRELPVIQAVPCCGLATTVIDEETASRVAPMFKALGDPVRLRLMALIAGSPEGCVCALTGQFAVSGPTNSHHLKVLREAGLISGERRGTWVYYRANAGALQQLGVLLQPVPVSA